MLGQLVRHSFLAVLLAVMIEELGVPCPIPTDLLIIFVGTTAGAAPVHLGLLFVALTLASAAGGSGLYFMVRRGGRPLVDRFGRYVHLGPQQLDRAEALISRGGWASIAVGRAIPGVRYATVITCGLVKVPFPTYLVGHVVGSSVYIAVFLALGAIFGQTVLGWLHIPSQAIRLLWLLPLAIGLPLLALRWGRHAAARQPESPSRWSLVGALVAAGFAGTVALAAALSATGAVAEVMGAPHPLNVAYSLLGWLLLGVELGTGVTAVVLYTILLALLVGLATTYNELLLPFVRPHGYSPSRQVVGLALLAFGLLGGVFALSLFVERDGSFDDVWWQAGGPTMLVGLALGVMAYATVAVYGRLLAVAMAPTPARPRAPTAPASSARRD